VSIDLRNSFPDNIYPASLKSSKLSERESGYLSDIKIDGKLRAASGVAALWRRVKKLSLDGDFT